MTLRILIAEDSATNRMLFSMTLSRLGHQADIATNGMEAIEMFGKNTYDLVLLDLNMPVVNGISTAREIQKTNASNIPVYAISGFPSAEMEAKFESVSIRRCLIKPIDREKLDSIISECGLAQKAEGNAAAPAASPTMSRKLADTYVRELKSRAAACEKYFTEGNRSALHREAHTIRSLAQMLKMAEMEQAAARIEESCIKKDATIDKAWVGSLVAHCHKAATVIEEGIKADHASASASGGSSTG